jgi:anti-anti-sigma factor
MSSGYTGVVGDGGFTFDVQVDRSDPRAAAVVRPRGEVAIHSQARLRAVFDALIAEASPATATADAPALIILAMGEVPHVDGEGVGLLLDLSRDARVVVYLAELTPAVWRMFNITRFVIKRLAVFETVEEALEAAAARTRAE